MERLRRVRRDRDDGEVASARERLERAARGADNLMPPILDCVRAWVTLGEVSDTLRGVFGTHD